MSDRERWETTTQVIEKAKRLFQAGRTREARLLYDAAMREREALTRKAPIIAPMPDPKFREQEEQRSIWQVV